MKYLEVEYFLKQGGKKLYKTLRVSLIIIENQNQCTKREEKKKEGRVRERERSICGDERESKRMV